MALRFKVTRLWVVHRGKRYNEGDLLPVEFTERDRVRNIYTRRIGQVEVPDEVKDLIPPQEPVDVPEVITPQEPIKEPEVITPPIVNTPPVIPTTPAEGISPSVIKTTGTVIPNKIPAKPAVKK